MAKPITQRAGTKYTSAPPNQEVTVDAQGTTPANFARMRPVTPAKQTSGSLFGDTNIDTSLDIPRLQIKGLSIVNPNQSLISGAFNAGVNTLTPYSNDNEDDSNVGEGSIDAPITPGGVSTRSRQLGRNYMKESRIAAREQKLKGKDRRKYMKEQRENKRSKMAQYRREQLGGKNSNFWSIKKPKDE